MQEVRTCPKCGRIYREYPALSRKDSKTEICSMCGVREAMESFVSIFNERDAKREEVN